MVTKVRAELSEAWSYDLLRRVRWPSGITRPYCGQRRVTTHTKAQRTPRRRYLCLGCRRTFTDLTGTPLAGTNLPVSKWVLCLQLLRQPLTTADLAKELSVKWDTAVRLQRRLVVALARTGFIAKLRETVEGEDKV